jgi:hypothetical protein
MSPQAQVKPAGDITTTPGDRRKHQRYRATAAVEVTRENDRRRINSPIELVDLSITGIGLLSLESFAPDDRVKVRLRNVIRRFVKDVHGIVRWAHLTSDGRCRFGVELTSRFSALDMQLLKQLGQKDDPEQKVWV